MSDDRKALRELAALHGVQRSYTNVFGKRVTASVDSTLAVLRALGAPVASLRDAPGALRARREELARRPLEPVLVAWDGRLDEVVVRLPGAEGSVDLEVATSEEHAEPDGWEERVEAERIGEAEAGSAPYRIRLRRRVPIGRHRLHVRGGGVEAAATLLSAPVRCPQPDRPAWGVFAPLYALRADDDWGVGSFSDLARFLGWVTGLGGSVAATLPLFAQFLDEPMVEPSPYSPASRLFWNETYIDVDRAPGLEASAEARAELDDPVVREQLARLRKAELADHPAVAAAKRRILEPLARRAFEGTVAPGLAAFAADPRAADYARFRAEAERRGAWWGEWPEAERAGTLPGSAVDDDRGRYHLYAQWVAAAQLAEAAGTSATGGLMLDLPIGVNGAGYDVWRERRSFGAEAAAGAPPDAFWSQGQDWGAPPPHPDGAREEGYRYHAECLRTLFRYAAVARIDHVIGLHRLYWVPRGASPRDGVYVRYRSDEWYALLSIAANERGAVVVGEDLGTVPGSLRPAMRKHGLLRTYVAQREANGAGLPDPPAESVAALNTHDMPTWVGFWRGSDLPLREELGLIDHDQAEEMLEARRRLRTALPGTLPGVPPDDDGADPRPSLEGSLERLARSRAAIVMVSLGDLLGEPEPQNVPGTGPERPNWRRRYPWTLEELEARPEVVSTLERIDRARRGAARRQADERRGDGDPVRSG